MKKDVHTNNADKDIRKSSDLFSLMLDILYAHALMCRRVQACARVCVRYFLISPDPCVLPKTVLATPHCLAID